MINKTHEAVMVEEVLTYLVIDKNGVYIDCTFGAGGHSQEILKELQDEGRLIGIDRDVNVRDKVPLNLKSDNITISNINFFSTTVKSSGRDSININNLWMCFK